MPKTVEGTLRGGKVEFEQPPPGQDGERVLVTFLSQDVMPANPKMIIYGEFRSGASQGQWSDFTDAKRAMYKNIDGDQDADAPRG